MSRRILFGIAIAALLILAFAAFAWAQTPVASETPVATATTAVTVPETQDEQTPTGVVPSGCPGGNFVDNDGDGLCDRREDAATGSQWGPSGRMGGMMQSGMMQGKMMQGMMQTGMMQNGMMQNGQNFVDADEDGICDRMENGATNQPGQTTHHGMGRMGGGMGQMGGGMGHGWDR